MNKLILLSSCLLAGLISADAKTFIVDAELGNGSFEQDTDGRALKAPPPAQYDVFGSWGAADISALPGIDRPVDQTRTWGSASDGALSAAVGRQGGKLNGAVQHTGYRVQASDHGQFNLSFDWSGSSAGGAWDADDNLQVALFTSSDDTLSGALTEIWSGSFLDTNGNNKHKAVVLSRIGTVTATSAGRDLFIVFSSGTAGANSNEELAYVDNVLLSTGQPEMLVFSPQPQTLPPTGKEPNVLLIMADDLGWYDLSCQGATDFETPNFDALAASGIRFTDGYVTAPQCGPSRAGLMSGLSQSRFGCLDNSKDEGLPPQSVVQILPEQLKARGYTTGMIGKWHVGFKESEKEGHYTLPGHHPWERGFDYVLKHHGGMSHLSPYSMVGWKWMTERKREPRLQQMLEGDVEPTYLDGLPKETYLTDIFSEKGADFVRRHDGKPWFLYLSYNAPHTPCTAPKDKMDKYAHIKDHKRRVLAAMMDSLDEGIGRVLQTLEETGQRENTIVWFLSDNGGPTEKNGSRNDPFSGLKGDLFEGGIRVPFMVSWPGTIPGGRTVSDPVISLDILPTSLAVAGVEQVAGIHEGNNLLPWLKGEADCPNDVIYWSWRSISAIRMGSLKETRNGRDVLALDGTTVPRRSFTDLKYNPQELAAKAIQSPEKKQMLSSKLDTWLRQLHEDAEHLTPSNK